MADITIEIYSLTNHQLLHALIKNQPDSKGRTTFELGDTKDIVEGITIRYDHQVKYEAEQIAEPIFFTIILAVTTGAAGSLAAAYIWKNIEQYVPKIKDLRIGGRKVNLTKSDVADAFLKEIDKLEKEDKQDKA